MFVYKLRPPVWEVKGGWSVKTGRAFVVFHDSEGIPGGIEGQGSQHIVAFYGSICSSTGEWVLVSLSMGGLRPGVVGERVWTQADVPVGRRREVDA